MKRFPIYIVLAALVVAVLIVFLNRPDQSVPKGPADPQNATYQINGWTVEMHDGVSLINANGMGAGNARTITTHYFGNELMVDLNGDGRKDSVFFVTVDTGGSGTFYYVVAALQTDNGYVGSEGVLVGDRIAPQSINIESAGQSGGLPVIAVNYADRAPGQPFTTQPSVGQTLYVRYDSVSNELAKVESTFEAVPIKK